MYLPLQTEALSLRLHGNGLGVHALVDRICRNLVAERVHRPFSIAQIVILVYFDVERIQAGQQLLIATWILVLEELHGTRHTRLDGRLLIGLADRNAQHRVRVFGQIQQVDQRGNIVEQRAENHATQAERVRGRLHRVQCQNRVVLRLRETIAAIERERVGRHFHALARGDRGIAMLVQHEHVQQRRGRDIRLPADFGKTLLGGWLGDADGGPVVQELAARRMLRHGLQRFDDVVRQRLRLEFTDGTTLQQSVDGCVMKNVAHTAIVVRAARFCKGIGLNPSPCGNIST